MMAIPLGMVFKDFIGLYMKDMEQRLKSTTVASKRWIIDLKITPLFGRMPLNEIKPVDVRRWQNLSLIHISEPTRH